MTPPRDITLLDGPGAERTRGVGVLEVLKAAEKVALPLAKVEIAAGVADRVAHVTVKQTFRNPNTEALEAVYIFPLAGGCAVSAFEMKVGKRTIKGICKERGEARAQYRKAVEDGKRAALMEQERDDVFTVQVGNLPPGEEVSVVITYSERLPFFEDGRTEIRLPLVVAPRYIPGAALDRPPVGDGTAEDTNQVPDASRITPPRLADGFDPKTALDIEVTLEDGEVDELACSQHATKTSFGADGVKVALARKDELLNRDFVLRWRVSGEKLKTTAIASGGYGMLSILPPKRDGFLGLARDVVFVVDRSGSMGGVKMASAARACSILLHTLGPRDRFAIQAFDDRPEWYEVKGTRWFAASEAGVEQGDKHLRTIADRGGTEMDAALQAAIAEVAARKETAGRTPILVFITDGEVGNESEILKRVQTQLGDARVFAVGVDTAVNSGFLKRLASLGGGTCTLVTPGDALDEALRSVGREIGAPLVTHLNVEGAEEIAPASMPDLFAGRAATVFFRCAKGAKVRVRGQMADGSKFDVSVTAKETKLPAIAHLWARTRVSELEDQFRMNSSSTVKQEIIRLAVAHTLLTKFTAFVVVDESEIVNQTGDVKKVVQPVHEPAEWKREHEEANGAMLNECMAAPEEEDATAISKQFGMAAKSKLDDCWDSGPPAASAPPPPPPPPAPAPMRPPSPRAGAGAPSAPKPPPVQAPQKQGLIGKILGAFGGKGGQDKEAAKRKPSGPPPEFGGVEKALEALQKAFAAAHAEVKAGRVPKADALEKARKELMSALTSEIGQRLGLLQRFLRAAMMEIVAALGAAGVTAAQLAPMFAQHAKALDAAVAEMKQASGDAAFWDATV